MQLEADEQRTMRGGGSVCFYAGDRPEVNMQRKFLVLRQCTSLKRPTTSAHITLWRCGDVACCCLATVPAPQYSSDQDGTSDRMQLQRLLRITFTLDQSTIIITVPAPMLPACFPSISAEREDLFCFRFRMKKKAKFLTYTKVMQ